MSTSGFRREPGDWPCSKCNEVNFKSRTACRRCATPRVQPTANNSPPTGVTPQIVPKQGDWTCHFCNNINFAARIACNKCGRQKQSAPNANANATAITMQKPGDWKCSSCPEMNFGSRTVCRSCGTARPSAEASNNDKSECVICMERAIDSVITTCGHSAVCLPCGNQITQCPVCRNTFNQQQIIKLYNVH
ncbi:hypothetical protein I4U23_006999 [Adineta vaga]|nr:hypothetical protein I4U23_006999 [Adineta vaga]